VARFDCQWASRQIGIGVAVRKAVYGQYRFELIVIVGPIWLTWSFRRNTQFSAKEKAQQSAMKASNR
jgi:hypothetical protein